jgi:NADH-quinone oxidoreductase subunit C
MPDATGLELLAHGLRKELGEQTVRDTVFFRECATVEIDPGRVRDVLACLRGHGYAFLASLHGVDYYPHEPRLGVHYELLDMSRVDRVTVKLRVPTEAPQVDSVTGEWPTADHQEREVYDMFGVLFKGHPDLRRILMPEDYEGHPQRRDFPTGGEPVRFTYNDNPALSPHGGAGSVSSVARVPKPGDTRSARIPVSASTLRSLRPGPACPGNSGQPGSTKART